MQFIGRRCSCIPSAMITAFEKLVERLFRLVEMIAVMALIVKICKKAYPNETALIVYVLGWGASYYLLSSTIGIMIRRVNRPDDKVHVTQRAAGTGFILLLAFITLYFVIHPIVVSVADIPFFPGDIMEG